MAPANETSKHDVSQKQIPLVLRAFPSPAISNVSLDSPTLTKTLSCLSSPGYATPYPNPLETFGIMPAEPGAAKDVPVMTPPAGPRRGCSDPTMDMIVGGALVPVSDVPPRPTSARAGPGLRLPSFQALGIAAPHSQRFSQQNADGVWTGFASARSVEAGVERQIGPEDALEPQPLSAVGAEQDVISQPVSPKATAKPPVVPLSHFVHTLTPPAETGEPDWRPPAVHLSLASAAMGSPGTDHGTAASEGASAGDGVAAATSAVQNVTISGPAVVTGERAWLDGAVKAVLTNLRTSATPNTLLKVLSHALPSPSPTGHTYTTIIEAIHDSTPTSPTCWINVFHAIPGRFNLEELPTSPPNTPGPPIGGDDYFTQKVFGSAVPITDYQQELTSLPRSPRPVVPPSSIDVAIVERYIPPNSMREFKEMFTVDGPSILIDRMIELSPHNGSLVFIYPTRTGAQTFMHEYLSPLLDPVLRSLVVANGFSSDLSLSLGAMPAVTHLLEHSDLERRTLQLCARLTQRSSSMARFHGRAAKFSLSYSATRKVPLSRQVWAKDWWTKQEKIRVTEVVTRAAQEAQTKSSNRHVDRPPTATELWQKLLRDVETRPYNAGQEPQNGVEVAVFVIKREV